MEVSDPWMIAFLIIVIISMICTPLVAIHIYYYADFNNLKYSLLFLLHITIYLEDISTLPYIWSSVPVLCQIMGWIHFYSGFSNVIVITLMGFHYLSYLIATFPRRINRWIAQYGIYVIFGFPLITLLPFSTNSYGISNDDWCTLPSGNAAANDWAIIIFYAWVWICLMMNIIQLSIAIYQLRKQEGVDELTSNVFSSIGMYILITTVCWLPRAVPRFLHLFINYDSSNLLYLLTTVPLYLSGIGYAICYAVDVEKSKGERERSLSSAQSNEFDLNADNIAQILNARFSSDNPIVSDENKKDFSLRKFPSSQSGSLKLEISCSESLGEKLL